MKNIFRNTLWILFVGAMAQGSFFADNNVIEGVSTIVSSGGSSTLLYNNNKNFIVTGSSNHDVVLPNATSMRVGNSFKIKNNGSGTVTIKYNDGSTLATLTASEWADVLLTSKATSNGTWSVSEPLPGGGVSVVTDAEVSASAAIQRSKLASGTPYRVLSNDSSGEMDELPVMDASAIVFTNENGEPITYREYLAFDPYKYMFSVGSNVGHSVFTLNGAEFTSVANVEDGIDNHLGLLNLSRHSDIYWVTATHSFLRSRGTHDTASIVQNGDGIGTISFGGYGTTSYHIAAQIIGEIDGTPGDSDMPGKLKFAVTPDGSDTSVDALIISSTSEITGASAVTFGGLMQSNSAVVFQDPGAGTNTVRVQAPDGLAASWLMKLPENDGDAGQVLQTDGSGVTSWAVASGGGGGSFVWNLPNSNAPSQANTGGMEVLDFAYTASQEIWAQFKVPATYAAGAQVQIKGCKFAASATSGQVFFKTTAYLVEAGSTVLGTYSNSHASTNSEVTVSGVASTITDIGNLDITDGSGQINGQAVAANDTILIKLIRDEAAETSSAASDARFLRGSCEPTTN